MVNLVKQGAVDITLIDDAVKRILTVKFELGLFDDPYRYNYREKEIENKKVNAATSTGKWLVKLGLVQSSF